MAADTAGANGRRVTAAALTQWAADCLVRVGVAAVDAQTVAGALVQTSLWGIDSHGIARLGHYLARIEAGSIAPVPAVQITASGPCTAQMDGGHGLGIVDCTAAMAHAIELAQSQGVCALPIYFRTGSREGQPARFERWRVVIGLGEVESGNRES